MSRKKKVILFICSLTGVALLSSLGALPYGYCVLSLATAFDDGLIETLCWALYLFVSVLLWLTVWRVAYVAAKRWPGRK